MDTEQFQQIADLLPGAAILVSTSGEILAASGSLKSEWGWVPEATLGRRLQDCFADSADEVALFLQVCQGTTRPIPLALTFADENATKQESRQFHLLGKRIESSAQDAEFQILIRGELSPETEEVDSRDRLLSLLVHDFRNGLASVPMGFDVLELEHGKSETLALLRRQIDRLVHLVDEVLDVSRLLRGKIKLRREPIVLQETIEEVVLRSSGALEQRQLTLEKDLPANPITIQADPQRLIQALQELILQRSKNMPLGGKLNLSVTTDSDLVRIRVQDSGQVIDPQLLPHVFDVLSQVQYSMKSNRTQLEFALALAGGLIALHGGRISAAPLPTPPGMEFLIELPLYARN